MQKSDKTLHEIIGRYIHKMHKSQGLANFKKAFVILFVSTRQMTSKVKKVF